MKKCFLLLFLTLLLLIPSSFQEAETTSTAIYTPFEARYIDVNDEGILYAIDYNGTVWSYNTTQLSPSWSLELVTANTSESQYNTLWISPYWDYSVFVSVGYQGIWKLNSSGWMQINDYGINQIPKNPWHWTENPLNGTLYLQDHHKYIYNSTDGGDTWNLFYNMTASDSSYYAGAVDDHFHSIGFDNETQSLWASGGDTRDILRRYNSSGQWEIVGIDAGSLGGLGNVYQPTSVHFDESYVYFGPDAGTKGLRINKTISSSSLPVSEIGSDVEIILNLDSTVYEDNEWVFESRYFDSVHYMPTCYEYGYMLVSINGVEWINVFSGVGLTLDQDIRAGWKGGISSITYRTPVYFIYNMNVYRLNLNSDDFRHLYNEPFVSDDNQGTLTVNRGVTTGSGYVGLGEDVNFIEINMSMIGASIYQTIENNTFEPGFNGSWIEDGWGTLNVTDMDSHSGSYSLQNIITNGTDQASFVFPPHCPGTLPADYGISSQGEGQYFLSCWLKTNVTWSEPPVVQPKFYLAIRYVNTVLVETEIAVRINITTSWTQQFHSVYLPSDTFQIRPNIQIFRENNTVREVYIDDVMFWGPLRYSYVDATRQHYVSPAYTNSWGIDETRRDTENITISIGGVEATYNGVLANGTEITLGSVTSDEVTYKNIIPYTVTVENSSQALIYMIVSYEPNVQPVVPYMFILGMIGLASMFGGPILAIKMMKENPRWALTQGVMFTVLGMGLFMAWLSS